MAIDAIGFLLNQEEWDMTIEIRDVLVRIIASTEVERGSFHPFCMSKDAIALLIKECKGNDNTEPMKAYNEVLDNGRLKLSDKLLKA